MPTAKVPLGQLRQAIRAYEAEDDLVEERQTTLDPQPEVIGRAEQLLNRLAADADRHEQRVGAGLRSELRTLQSSLRELIAANPSATYRTLINELVVRISRHVIAMDQLLAAGIHDAAASGADMVDRYITAVGGEPLEAPALNDAMVASSIDHTASLIEAAGAHIHAGTTNQIDLVTAGLDIQEALAAVGTTLDSQIFALPAARVAAIAVTELGAVHGAAAQNRLAQSADRYTNLRKRWVASGSADPRSRHQAVAAVGSIGPGEMFEVGPYRARWPRDPRLPGSERVNCGCRLMPVITT